MNTTLLEPMKGSTNMAEHEFAILVQDTYESDIATTACAEGHRRSRTEALACSKLMPVPSSYFK